MHPVTITHMPPRLLAGFSFFGDPFHSHAGWTEANEIGRVWQRLLNYLHTDEAPAAVDTMYEVHVQNHETPNTGEFEVFVGYEVDTLAAVSYALCAKTLPEAAYAVFTLQGSEIKFDEPLIDNWLTANGYRVALPLFIQRYDSRFKGLDRLDDSELDFLVPVMRDG